MKKIILILILLVCSSNSFALTGNDIRANCASEHQELAALCLYYIAGFHAGFGFGKIVSEIDAFSSFDFCLPDGYTNGLGMQVLNKYMSDHPEKLHEGAYIIVASAFSEAFPCAE